MDTPSRGQQFAALVQAQTTVISLLPFLIGLVFAGYYYQHFNLGDSILLLVAVVAFHLAVNGHNQYTDYRRFKNAHNQHSYNNIIQKFHIKKGWAQSNIALLVIIAAAIGLYLTFKAGWILLLIGVVSFLVGYCYSGGPYPILKTPFGEPFSGITMGYNIVLLGVFINIYNRAPFDPWFWLKALVVAAPAILTISNVMLGNNICDVQEDEQIGKKTLVHYIGRPAAMRVLAGCYLGSFLMIIVGVACRLLPAIDLACLLAAFPVYSSIKKFIHRPDKATTFFNVLISLQLILISEIVLTLVGIVIGAH